MRNVFIIGNGFDLDLGLSTKYSDFAQSKYWPTTVEKQIKENEIHTTVEKRIKENEIHYKSFFYKKPLDLKETIENAKNKETWFDIEKELLEYSQPYYLILHTGEKTTFQDSADMVNNNINYFHELRDSLNKYILEVQNTQKVKECTASDVLRAIIGNSFFDNIYSFNYTDLNLIAKQIGINQEIKYTHLHGNASDNSIILGVDETQLRKGYEIFHKSSSRYYRSHNLYNSLTTADEIVIFGLSFGSIDYSYFDSFFKGISEGEYITEEQDQYITIFTKDDKSRLAIISNLRSMGINIQRLYSHTHFQIICAADNGEQKELADFYKRLKEEKNRIRQKC